MKTHNFKKDIDYRLSYGLIIVMVLLMNVLLNDALGCVSLCSPCDTPIYDFDGHFIRCSGCIADCGICYSCASGNCQAKFPQNYECCGCVTICNNNNCKMCEYTNGTYSCQSWCRPSECEICDGAMNCVVCDGDPSKECCNGQCYDRGTQEYCNGTCCDFRDCKYCGYTESCESFCNTSDCETCDGNGRCVVCGGVQYKDCCNGTCYDTISQGCCGGTIYDRATQQCCYGNVCPSIQWCCNADQTCHDECVNTEPSHHCDTTHDNDPENICPGCTGGILETHCMDLTFREYTGNENRNCSGGCPGECARHDVICYTEYKCREEVMRFGVCGTVEGAPGGLGCKEAGTYLWCIPCHKDTDFPGEDIPVVNRACGY